MFVAADYIGPSLPAFRKCTEGSVLVCTYTKRHRSLAVGRYDLRMVVAAMECTLTECPNAIHGRASVSTGDPFRVDVTSNTPFRGCCAPSAIERRRF